MKEIKRFFKICVWVYKNNLHNVDKDTWQKLYFSLKKVVNRQKAKIIEEELWHNNIFYSVRKNRKKSLSKWQILRLELEELRTEQWKQSQNFEETITTLQNDLLELQDIKEKYIHLKASIKILRLSIES